MKKLLKIIFVVAILGAVGVGVYFLFFQPVKAKDVFAYTQTFLEVEQDSDVDIVDTYTQEMEEVLKNNDVNGNGVNSKEIIKTYLSVDALSDKIMYYTYRSVLFADGVDNYRKELKNSYSNLVSSYQKCSNYISDYYLKISSRTSTSIPDSDKGALVGYINNYVVLLQDLQTNKIEFCKYLCFCQKNSYKNNINQTALNSLYLEVSGYAIEYYPIKTITKQDSKYDVNTSAIEGIVSKIYVSSAEYYDNITKYDELISLKDSIDVSSLIEEYLIGRQSDYLNSLIATKDGETASESATKKYENSEKFLNEILK